MRLLWAHAKYHRIENNNIITYKMYVKKTTKGKGRNTLDMLSKSNIWTVSESELNLMLIEGKKHENYQEYETHYMNIIKTVFDIQYFNREDEEKIAALRNMHYEVFMSPNEGGNNAIAIRKRPIKKVTDLTHENIFHLDTLQVLELIERNMGTGWKALPLSIQDIIESAFYVDCSTLPEKVMHRPGGAVERHKADGYDVLELVRGTWIEAIFIKPKPRIEKPHLDYHGSRYEMSGDDDEFDDDDIPMEPESDDDEEDVDNLPDSDTLRDDDDEEEDFDDDRTPTLDDLEDFEVVEDADEEEE